MVNELRELLRENAASPPPDDVDLTGVLSGGRRRVRRRRGLAVVGGTALATAAVVALTSLVGQDSGTDGVADRPPSPDAPTLRLGDAATAVEGRDYQLLESYTNDDLDAANGQYLDGVTDDGKILFTDGPHGLDNTVRRALMDPATGEKDWLPAAPDSNEQLWPVHLGADRLVFTSLRYALGRGGNMIDEAHAFALVYDRDARTWQRIEWPELPTVDGPPVGVLGPEDRLFIRVPATRGEAPPAGWPTSPDGDAEDAGAPGDTYHLWSVSLTDPGDVRDEQLVVGDVAFTDDSMVWTDRTNGDAGTIHVRDLATGDEHSFDPQSGDRCNLLSFGATDDRIVLGQYCGTYGAGVRDDRIQILTTDGDQVVTIQDDSIDGGLADDGRLVTIDSYRGGAEGTYVYDLADDRFLRVSDSVSRYDMGGPTPPGLFLWDTSANGYKGATQWLGEIID